MSDARQVLVAIKSNLVNKVAVPPQGINDRLMTASVPLPKKRFVTLFSAYTSPMTNPDEVKERFYEDLKDAISAVPRSDKLIILGDFNARVGSDHMSWEGVLGRHGIGKSNSKQQTCAAHGLLITNTVFRLTTRNKTSWMHPCSKHWHVLD